MRFPQQPPDFSKILSAADVELRFDLLAVGRPALDDGRYLHWDELRFRTPPPKLSAEQWWASTKIARLQGRAFT